MQRVLITGISGVGKSTVITELARRGYWAVDLDQDGYSHEVSVSADELTGLGPGRDWIWCEDRVAALLARDDADVLFLSGCAPNQGTFYPQLDHVILLTAPADVIVERLTTRTNNPFGKHLDEVARVLALKETIEPLLRRGAHHEIDTSVPLDEVIAEVLQIVGSPI